MTLSTVAVAVLVGVLLPLALPSLVFVPALALAGIVAAFACASRAPGTTGVPVAGTIALLISAVHLDARLAARWPPADDGTRVLAEVTIASIPVADVLGVRFDGIVIPERAPDRRLRARLWWPTNAMSLAPGERWRLLLVLESPRGRVNPHAHDAERQFLRERIDVLARVVPSGLNGRLRRSAWSLDTLRASLAGRIAGAVGERDAAALIAALAVGHTGEMSREQWRVFNATGTTHLVAISGMHVTLFAVVGMAIARRAWRPLSAAIRIPRESFAGLVGFAAAGAYTLLAGFAVPAQRTLIMLGAWLAVRAGARQSSPASPLALAAVLVLAIDPLAPLAAGFWLSFLAMSAIIVALAATVAPRSAWRQAMRVQLAVALVLAPATLVWFGGVSLAGMVVNLAAIPVVSFVFVPLVLLGVVLSPLPGAAELLWNAAAAMHGALWPWLVTAADHRLAIVHATPPMWWVAGAGAVAFFAVCPWPLVLRVAALMWLLPFAFVARPLQAPLEITLLDTGRAVAAVARTQDRALVFGLGESHGTDGGRVGHVLLPWLRGESIGTLDMLVLDRVTAGSVRGLNALLATVPVERVLVAAPEAGAASITLESCASAAPFAWGPVIVTIESIEGGCRLELAMGVHRAHLDRAGLVLRDDSGRARLAALAGAVQRPKREAPLIEQLRRDGAVFLTTEGSGAITVRLDAATLRQVLEARREPAGIWRLRPVPQG